MFEVNETYANRKGTYTVLEIGPTKMKVRYEDGTEAELNINIQERIWQNIQADKEAAAPKIRKKTAQNNFFIKSIHTISDEELNIPAIKERVTPTALDAPEINQGDRFIYYAADSQSFFAIATITGEPKEVDAKAFADLGLKEGSVNVYPIDLDGFSNSLEQSVSADSVELESQPTFKEELKSGEKYLPISEDDFELLAELIVEVIEEDEEDLDLDDDVGIDEDDLDLVV